jgi:hypothetical protein
MNIRLRPVAILGFVLFLFPPAFGESFSDLGGVASSKEATTQNDSDWVDGRWSKTDVGTFLGACIETPRKKTPRAIAIKVGGHAEGTVCFDTDLLRYAAAWTGGFLEFHPQRYGLISAPTPKGEIQFTTAPRPGCAHEGSFADPRKLDFGCLPENWGKYKGLYLSGNRVVLRYTVGSSEISESPWLLHANGISVFTRTIEKMGDGQCILRLLDEEGGVATILPTHNSMLARLRAGSAHWLVSVQGPGAKLVADSSKGSGINLDLSQAPKAKVYISKTDNERAFLDFVRRDPGPRSLAPYLSGGASHWEILATRGSVGRSSGPFAVDTLTLPYKNPWKALLFASGHDFLPNGDIVLSTIHGDVWIVSGIDAKLDQLRWKRFATGLHQPLGVKVVDRQIYVLERDQITRLRDLNRDGEADYYENFNNDCISGGAPHGFSTCLETDPNGDFYFLKCGEDTPHGGTVLRVPRDGRGIEVVATGFRNPNGMSISPGGLITVADQQGNWVPETRLDIIHPGGFYGFVPMSKRAHPPESFEPPLCWIPRSIDNSAGGQVWVPEGTWAELSGQLLHLSYGRCAMMLVLRDANHPMNGAEVPLPARFLSGAMRARFNPYDGNLYVSGLRGWQTAAVKDGCLQRVRFTGAPLNFPIGYSIQPNGLELKFARTLDRSTTADLSSYSAEQWNYKWTANYGSPEYSLKNKGKTGRDLVPITRASLSTDGHSLLLEFQPKRVNVLRISYNLETTEGDQLGGEFFCTINDAAASARLPNR